MLFRRTIAFFLFLVNYFFRGVQLRIKNNPVMFDGLFAKKRVGAESGVPIKMSMGSTRWSTS